MAGVDKVALGLDDIIRSEKSSNRRGGGGAGGNRGFRGRSGRGGGNGGNNAFRNRGGGGIPRAQNAPGGRWKHDLYENNGGQKSVGVNTSAKLLISNLDFGVTTNDVEELFGDIGAVRIARVHFDETGRSLGTAEVVFERRADAVTAVKKYNGLNLDGRPMDIKLVGGSVDGGSQSVGNRLSGNFGGNRNQRFGNRNGGGGNNNNQQNGFRGNRTRGGKQNGGGKKEEVTADDLDADLEAYRAESKQNKE